MKYRYDAHGNDKPSKLTKVAPSNRDRDIEAQRAALAERVEKDLVASCLERLIVALRQAAKDTAHDR